MGNFVNLYTTVVLPVRAVSGEVVLTHVSYLPGTNRTHAFELPAEMSPEPKPIVKIIGYKIDTPDQLAKARHVAHQITPTHSGSKVTTVNIVGCQFVNDGLISGLRSLFTKLTEAGFHDCPALDFEWLSSRMIRSLLPRPLSHTSRLHAPITASSMIFTRAKHKH